MGKNKEQTRRFYMEKAKIFYTTAKSILDTEHIVLDELKKNPPDAALKKLWLADKLLYLTSIYIVINGISCAILKTKNEEALNEGRKTINRILIYLEDIVTSLVDAPFSEYEEKLDAIESYDADKRFNLVKKTGLSIELLKEAYGENSKWRWTFVEMEGRFTAIAKNIIDFKNINQNKTPGSPYYASTVYHLRLIIMLLNQSADRYREMYEQSTSSVHDFKKGISFLEALRRLQIVLGEANEAEELKKKITSWTSKMTADEKKANEAKKRS